MTEIARKLEKLADRIEKDKGPLRLLAMFFRDDAPPTWDLIVSARHLHLDNGPDLDYLSDLLDRTLNRREILTLSRMIVFEYRDPQTDEALREIQGRTGYMELRGDFVGFPIRAEVIGAEPPREPSARPRKSRRKSVPAAGRRSAAARRRPKPTRTP